MHCMGLLMLSFALLLGCAGLILLAQQLHATLTRHLLGDCYLWQRSTGLSDKQWMTKHAGSMTLLLRRLVGLWLRGGSFRERR